MIVFNELRCRRCGRFFRVGQESTIHCPRCYASICQHFRVKEEGREGMKSKWDIVPICERCGQPIYSAHRSTTRFCRGCQYRAYRDNYNASKKLVNQ